ncbi:hypothetical protein ACFL20_05960 [Spirochaetota bacterium]
MSVQGPHVLIGKAYVSKREFPCINAVITLKQLEKIEVTGTLMRRISK